MTRDNAISLCQTAPTLATRRVARTNTWALFILYHKTENIRSCDNKARQTFSLRIREDEICSVHRILSYAYISFFFILYIFYPECFETSDRLLHRQRSSFCLEYPNIHELIFLILKSKLHYRYRDIREKW